MYEFYTEPNLEYLPNNTKDEPIICYDVSCKSLMPKLKLKLIK